MHLYWGNGSKRHWKEDSEKYSLFYELADVGVLDDPQEEIVLLCVRAAKHLEETLANTFIHNSDRGRGSMCVGREINNRG